jgi:hypothetical protein
MMFITISNTQKNTQGEYMGMTPYEVRLEVLKLAKDVLEVPVMQTREALIDEYHSNREGKIIDYPNLPKLPTTEQIIAEAEKLNDFISNG